jgi:hypothetical protein
MSKAEIEACQDSEVQAHIVKQKLSNDFSGDETGGPRPFREHFHIWLGEIGLLNEGRKNKSCQPQKERKRKETII